VNCKFYHNPAVQQQGEAERAVERADIVAELNLSLAHAAALLGQWERAATAVKAGRKSLRCGRREGEAAAHLLVSEIRNYRPAPLQPTSTR
jgi:hypothetical protein